MAWRDGTGILMAFSDKYDRRRFIALSLFVTCFFLSFGYFSLFSLREIFNDVLKLENIVEYGPDISFGFSLFLLIFFIPVGYYAKKNSISSNKKYYVTITIVVVAILFLLPHFIRQWTNDFFGANGYHLCIDHPEYHKRRTGRQYFDDQVWVLDPADCTKELDSSYLNDSLEIMAGKVS